MNSHHRKIGHVLHHRIEIKTSLAGPMYRCHCCWGLYETIIQTNIFGSKMRYCLDCADKINLIESTIQHIEDMEDENEKELKG